MSTSLERLTAIGDRVAELDAALDAAKEERRIAIIAAYEDNFTWGAIATAGKCTTATVNTTLRNAGVLPNRIERRRPAVG